MSGKLKYSQRGLGNVFQIEGEHWPQDWMHTFSAGRHDREQLKDTKQLKLYPLSAGLIKRSSNARFVQRLLKAELTTIRSFKEGDKKRLREKAVDLPWKNNKTRLESSRLVMKESLIFLQDEFALLKR